LLREGGVGDDEQLQKALPVRKTIRLKDHDYSQAGYYFVTLCVKDGHEMLGRVVAVVGDDAHIVPPFVARSKYGDIVDKHIKNIDNTNDDVFVDKYVVMPNHVHMILVVRSLAMNGGNGTMWASSPTTARIPSVVRSLKTLVAKECGFSFWQRSYHDHIIRDEDEYKRIWQYIDENPANWAEDEYCT